MEQIMPIIADSPYIKLSVSTKGVYTWDIKVIGSDIAALVKIDDELKKKFGTQGSSGLIIGKED